MKLLSLTAKIKMNNIRQRFDIPIDGFRDEKEALVWYRQHYEQAKRKPLSGSLGYHFDFTRRTLDLDYEYDYLTRHFSIASVLPIDKEVPFDREVWLLGGIIGLDAYLMPALRLVVLVGKIQESLPSISEYMFVPLGSFRLLVQAPGALSDEQRRRLLDELITPETNIVIGFGRIRKNQKIGLYFDVFGAYADWIGETRQREERGEKVSRKGYLISIAKRLVRNYGWQSQPSSYTVKRYLDRASDFFNFPDLEKQTEINKRSKT